MLPKHFMVSESDGHLYDTRRPEWFKHPLRYNYARIERNVDGNSTAIRAAIRARYTFPGSYEIFGIANDGECLCTKCMRENYYLIAWSVRHRVNDGWRIVAIDATCNVDGPIDCANCGRVLIEGEE